MTNPDISNLYQQIEESYRTAAGNTGRDAAAFGKLREDAISAFRASGFPTIKEEDWRFTNLTPFLDGGYKPFTESDADLREQAAGIISRNTLEGLDAYRLVLVNGSIDFTLSSLPDSGNLIVQPLKSIIHTDFFRDYLSSAGHTGNQAFTALNTALFHDGSFIEVKAGQTLDKPVEILHVYTLPEKTLIQPRHLWIINRNAKAEFIERSLTEEGHASMLGNSVSELVVKENGILSHCHIQQHQPGERWIHYTHVIQKKDSRYDNFCFTLPGGDLVRNNLEINLNGTGTDTHMYGLYLVGNGQLTDNHTAISHRHPSCQSNELYRGVLTGNGRAVFNGKIFVDPEAQQTNAFQQNNNILLSDHARVNAKPQLEIFADDVKCSHGCTIGQFNSESLFYLRSRGIGEAAARNLLVEAFAFDVLNRLDNEPVREFVSGMIREKTAAAIAAN